MSGCYENDLTTTNDVARHLDLFQRKTILIPERLPARLVINCSSISQYQICSAKREIFQYT